MNIDDLLGFKRVSELGSVHRAAAELGVSQPALSKAIRRLETSLGLTLFERTPRGMLLTEAGRVMHQRSLELSDWCRSIDADIQVFKAGHIGHLRVGVVPALLHTLLIPVARQLVQQNAAQLTIRVQLSDVLARLLENGEIDCAIAAWSDSLSSQFNHQILGVQRSFVVGRKGHPLLRRAFKEEDLKRQGWVMSPKHILLRQWIDRYLADTQQAGVQSLVEVDGTPTMLAPLLETTNLLAVLTEDALNSSACRNLRPFPSPAPSWSLEIALLWRRTAPFSRSMEQFRQLIVRQAQEDRNTNLRRT